jgi:hypothetical protein
LAGAAGGRALEHALEAGRGVAVEVGHARLASTTRSAYEPIARIAQAYDGSELFGGQIGVRVSVAHGVDAVVGAIVDEAVSRDEIEAIALLSEAAGIGVLSLAGGHDLAAARGLRPAIAKTFPSFCGGIVFGAREQGSKG